MKPGASIAVAAVLWSVLAGHGIVRAEERTAGGGFVDPEARALYADGLRLYRAGAYDAAIAKLEASYRLVPAPGLLYDLAQAHRLKGDCAGARDLYRAYLDKPANGEAAELARAHLVELEACATAASESKKAAEQAAKQATEKAAETAAAVEPAPPAPPAPSLVPSSPTPVDDPSQRLVATPAAPVSSARHGRFFGRPAVVALAATSAALAVSAGIFAWRAADSADQVSGSFRPGVQWDQAGMDAESRGQTSARLGLAAAVGMLVTGGIAAWLAARD